MVLYTYNRNVDNVAPAVNMTSSIPNRPSPINDLYIILRQTVSQRILK